MVSSSVDRLNRGVTGFLLTAALVGVFVGRSVRSPLGSRDITAAFFKRADWGAAECYSRRCLKTPVPNVFLHRTDSEPCFTKRDGLRGIKRLQNQHMQREGEEDIRFNFVVDEAGNIYEGRGWDVIGSHTVGYNDISIGIAVMGNNFMCRLPSKKALEAVKSLIDQGVAHGKIAANYKLYGHQDSMTSVTECPGAALLRHIREWKNYDIGQPARGQTYGQEQKVK